MIENIKNTENTDLRQELAEANNRIHEMQQRIKKTLWYLQHRQGTVRFLRDSYEEDGDELKSKEYEGAFVEAIGAESLLEAILDGNDEHIDRMCSTYVDQTEIELFGGDINEA